LVTYSNVPSGIYTCEPFPLESSTEWLWGRSLFAWSVNITDGISWFNKTYYYRSDGFRNDVNNDGEVDFVDAGQAWVHRADVAAYDGLYDVNNDGTVNFVDVGIIWTNNTRSFYADVSELDPLDYLLVGSDRIIFTDIPRSCTSSISKSYPTDYFDDFIHTFEFSIQQPTEEDTLGMTMIWGVTNGACTWQDLQYNDGHGIGLGAQYFEPPLGLSLRIWFYAYGSNEPPVSLDLGQHFDTTIYVTVAKTDNTFTADFYGDPQRTVLYGTHTMQLYTEETYDTLVLLGGRGDPYAEYSFRAITGWIGSFYEIQ